MSFFTLKDFNVKEKKVLVRVDFDVPVKNGKIMDDARIKASLPTIQYLAKNKAVIILLCHIGRPRGRIVEELRTGIVADYLEKLLKKKVIKLDDCIGETVEDEIDELKAGEICILENVRFYPEEEKNDSSFAESLGALADFFINDAFATAHRAHASVSAIAQFLPSCTGLQLEKEIKILSDLQKNPKRPFIAVLGGVKVGDKIKLVERLAKLCDAVIIGGAMCFTFLKSMNYSIGKNFIEKEFIKPARKLLKTKKVVLPLDFKTKNKKVGANGIKKNDVCLDIGSESVKYFCEVIKNAKTIVWNGPMGRFEENKYASGTKGVADCIAKIKKVTSIIGGGDTVSAIKKFKFGKKFSHLSTGGGAMLGFLEGRKLPAVKALEENYKKFSQNSFAQKMLR